LADDLPLRQAERSCRSDVVGLHYIDGGRAGDLEDRGDFDDASVRTGMKRWATASKKVLQSPVTMLSIE